MSDKVEALTRSHLLPDSIAPTSVETVAVHLDPSWMDIRYIDCAQASQGSALGHQPFESHMALLDSFRVEPDRGNRTETRFSQTTQCRAVRPGPTRWRLTLQ